MTCEVLQRLGLTPEIKLSDPGILRSVLSRAGYDQTEQLSVYDRVLDGDAGVFSEVLARVPEASAAAAELLAMEGDGPAFLANLRSVLEPGIPDVAPVISELATIADVLTGIGHTPKIAPALVRNFEYYTGPVFHFFVEGTKVAGGGRYDALISQVGGQSVPASGFALEIDPLASFLSESEFGAEPAIVIRSAGKNGADVGAVFTLARALRDAGVSVQLAGSEGGPSRAVLASSDGFSLTSGDGKSRRLNRVEEVVRAVSDAGHD